MKKTKARNATRTECLSLRDPVGEGESVNLRKNQNALSTSEKQAFVAAVLALKQKPSRLHPGDPNFGRYDDFVEVHLDAMMPPMMTPPQPGWAHQSCVFTPWHRALLVEFENELQAVEPAVSIPYWDWT